MQCIEHSYQGLVLPSLKWKRAFPSELKLYFTTSPSFFQAHFLSPSSVMFLTWFQTSELDSQYSTPSRWLSANSSLIALFYVVVKVELLAHHLLSWVTGDERRDNEPRKQRAGQWGTDISRSAACHGPSSRGEEMAVTYYNLFFLTVEHSYLLTVLTRGVSLSLYLVRRDNDGLLCKWQKESDCSLLLNLQSHSLVEKLHFSFL